VGRSAASSSSTPPAASPPLVSGYYLDRVGTLAFVSLFRGIAGESVILPARIIHACVGWDKQAKFTLGLRSQIHRVRIDSVWIQAKLACEVPPLVTRP
jgi:hypothetical protein